jgi:hypothetical protein
MVLKTSWVRIALERLVCNAAVRYGADIAYDMFAQLSGGAWKARTSR